MISMIIVLMGAPGAGKGTQSEILRDRLHMVHVSSGELLRDHVKRGTELGKTAETYMKDGQLVPDDLVIEMIVLRISAPDAQNGILLDGFPRTLPQAQALDRALNERGRMVNGALYIKVHRAILMDRLSGRWTCRNCNRVYHDKAAPPKTQGVCDFCGGELYQRNDDLPETAKKRLDEFEKMMPIIEYYRDRRILCEVNGNQPTERVTKDILECLR